MTIALPLSQLTDKKMRLIGARMIAVTESLVSLRHSSDLATLSKALQVHHTYSRITCNCMYAVYIYACMRLK